MAPRTAAVLALLAATALAGAVATQAAAAPADDALGVSDTTDAFVDTTETLENTTEDSTGTLENTTEDSTDSLENTTEDSTDSLENTTEDTTDTLENATATLANATDSLLGTLETESAAVLDAAVDASLAAGTDGGTSSSDAGSTTVSHASSGTTDAASPTSTATETASDATPAGDRSPPSDGPAGGLGGRSLLLLLTAGAGAVVVVATGAAAGPGSVSGSSAGGVLTTVRALLSGWWHRVLGAIGYSRYDGSDPLEDPRRERVFAAVNASPGVAQSALADRTDVPLSSLRHHLGVLEDESLVVGVRLDGRRRYFPAEMAAADGSVSASVGPVGAAVLAAVSRHEPATGSDVAEALDRDPSTVSHHLSRLAEAGLVERSRSGPAVLNRLTAAAERELADNPFGPSPAADD